MAINLDNIGSNPIRDQNRALGADSGRTANEPASTTQPPQDRVELSDGARTLRSAARVVADLPAVDSSRVDEIRRAISEGRYHVDPVRLAQKFLELENDL
jgi:negative regulator of flagellin synthesis FlgM